MRAYAGSSYHKEYEMLEASKIHEPSGHFAEKLAYLAVGGCVGAAVALLLAPKSGRELRGDISNLANETLYSAVESASNLKQVTADYYEKGTDIAEQVLEVVSSGVSAVGDEVKSDA